MDYYYDEESESEAESESESEAECHNNDDEHLNYFYVEQGSPQGDQQNGNYEMSAEHHAAFIADLLRRREYERERLRREELEREMERELEREMQLQRERGGAKRRDLEKQRQKEEKKRRKFEVQMEKTIRKEQENERLQELDIEKEQREQYLQMELRRQREKEQKNKDQKSRQTFFMTKNQRVRYETPAGARHPSNESFSYESSHSQDLATHFSDPEEERRKRVRVTHYQPKNSKSTVSSQKSSLKPQLRRSKERSSLRIHDPIPPSLSEREELSQEPADLFMALSEGADESGAKRHDKNFQQSLAKGNARDSHDSNQQSQKSNKSEERTDHRALLHKIKNNKVPYTFGGEEKRPRKSSKRCGSKNESCDCCGKSSEEQSFVQQLPKQKIPRVPRLRNEPSNHEFYPVCPEKKCGYKSCLNITPVGRCSPACLKRCSQKRSFSCLKKFLPKDTECRACRNSGAMGYGMCGRCRQNFPEYQCDDLPALINDYQTKAPSSKRKSNIRHNPGVYATQVHYDDLPNVEDGELPRYHQQHQVYFASHVQQDSSQGSHSDQSFSSGERPKTSRRFEMPTANWKAYVCRYPTRCCACKPKLEIPIRARSHSDINILKFRDFMCNKKRPSPDCYCTAWSAFGQSHC